MRQMDSQRERSHFARHIAISGMALALCLISLMLEAAIVSACHLTFVQFFKRRLSKAIAPVAHTQIGRAHV